MYVDDQGRFGCMQLIETRNVEKVSEIARFIMKQHWNNLSKGSSN